ncbi:MAG: DUF2459 domain-containing protein, partial [Moraxellaceae bacterium]
MRLLNIKISIVIFFVALTTGCASTPRAKDVPIADVQHKIYFIYRSWHTSILFDAKTLAPQSPLLKRKLDAEKFARIGWGDGDYFTGKSKTWGTAAKALVVSKYSAIQLLTYNYDPFDEIPADTIVPLMITDEGFRNLSRYVNNSFTLDAQGNLLALMANGEATGEFFQANGHYGAFSNCNTWSGQALRAAGLPVSNRLTARGVFNQ